MQQNEEKPEKLKRFDDIFRMLLIVMTITTSIGLSTYSELNLWLTLSYFLISLGFWMYGHVLGSNPLFDDHEIILKLTAWLLALLVTASTFARFVLRVSILDLGVKLLIFMVTVTLTFGAYYWFGELIPSYTRRRYMRLHLIILGSFLAGYLVF